MISKENYSSLCVLQKQCMHTTTWHCYFIQIVCLCKMVTFTRGQTEGLILDAELIWTLTAALLRLIIMRVVILNAHPPDVLMCLMGSISSPLHIN